MISERMKQLGKNSSVIRELFEYGRKRKAEIGCDNVYDFSLGNPSVPAPQKVSEVISNLIKTVPAEKLHAYTSAAGDINVRKVIADYINDKYDVEADASLIYMTCGAAASLTITLNAIINKGDEVIAFAPYFPEYKVFAEQAGAKLVEVLCRDGDFQIDGNRFESSITESTKAVIINSPNNPTGAVISQESINILADILRKKEKEFCHPIYLISDEPYRELAYDVDVPYLTKYYEDTIITYSFSKSLSLPGERIGYIFVSPQLENCKDVFYAVCGAGRALGYVCAPALFQYMAKECIGLTSDISIYKKNRELLYNALISYGFEVVKPDGAFYMFVKSPESDANAFSDNAKKYELLLVPSDSFGCKGYVRIAYCVSTEQIQNSLPAFKKLANDYKL